MIQQQHFYFDNDDDFIAWNPDHFGHVDFKSEQDGQLTIFYEDSHEPPDPDDYPSLEAYEKAWTEWEQTQTLTQQEDKIMFNFTAPIDNEIAQLQAKLAELEAQKQLLASRESCANKILSDVEKCVVEMRGAGVDEQSLFAWAESIFSLITGDALPREKLNEAQDELNHFKTLKIEELQKELENYESAVNNYQSALDKWQNKYDDLLNTSDKQINRLTTERDQLLNKIEELTANSTQDLFRMDLLKQVSDLKIERDTALEKIQKLEKLNQINAKTISEFSQINNNLSEKILKLQGENIITITEVEDAKPLEDSAYLEATKNQEIAANFLNKIDRKARALAVTWEKLKELPINTDVMREIGLAARTKSHQILLDNMPQICADYINETGDKSDFEWLPEAFKNKVEALLKTADSEKTHEDDSDKIENTTRFEIDDAVVSLTGSYGRVTGFSDGLVLVDVEEIDANRYQADQIKLVLRVKVGDRVVVDDRMVDMHGENGEVLTITTNSITVKLESGKIYNFHPTNLKSVESVKTEGRNDDFSQAISALFSPGDTVIHLNQAIPMLPEDAWKVLDVKDGWVNVQDANGFTDMWKASDVEIVQSEAA